MRPIFVFETCVTRALYTSSPIGLWHETYLRHIMLSKNFIKHRRKRRSPRDFAPPVYDGELAVRGRKAGYGTPAAAAAAAAGGVLQLSR